MTRRTRLIVTTVRLLWLPAALILAACGTEVVRHEARITIRDPTSRLGAPPWHVEFGFSDRGMVLGYASPESPFRGTFSEIDGSGDHWLTSRSSTQEVGLRIPALGHGSWQGIILVSIGGASEGYARYGNFGHAEADGETLFLRGTAKPNPNGNGWYLDLHMEIPAAPTPEAIATKRLRRLKRVVPRKGTCSFGGVEGHATVLLEPDARVVVLVNGDARHKALMRPGMEAMLRAGGCGVVDHTRVDAALQQRLERNPLSLPVLEQVSQAAGATMVLMVDQQTGMAQLIEVATAEVPYMWPTRD